MRGLKKLVHESVCAWFKELVHVNICAWFVTIFFFFYLNENVSLIRPTFKVSYSKALVVEQAGIIKW